MWPWILLLDLLSFADKKTPAHPCLLQVQNGKIGRIGCVGDIEVTCEVACDGKYMGRYHCTKEEGWKETLPYCVKQNEDYSIKTLCSSDEMYSECQGHCERSCSDWDKQVDCPSNVCVGACVCNEGMVRGPDGDCVPPNSCLVLSNSIYDRIF